MDLNLLAAVIVLIHVLGFLSIIKAIMESRTPQGATAWALGLLVLPYVFLPAYWVFGRSKFRGFVKLLQKGKLASEDAVGKYRKVLAANNLVLSPGRSEAFAVESLAGLPFTTGNEAELLIDGDKTFKSIFSGIGRARDYILVQFYIVKDDELGNELKRRLIDKANQGVRVYFLYDEIGSMGLPGSYLKDMTKQGVQCFRFNTRKGRTNRFQVNFRNHRKIVVVDGKEAWVGGHNVGEEYLGKKEPWRDTHVRVYGPVAQSIQVSFLEDWYWAAESLIDLNWQPEKCISNDSVAALAVPTGPADEFETCTLLFLQAIQSAKKRLWIATPYFVPDEQFLTALHLATLRGVEVKILIPRKTDNFLVTLTHWAMVQKLLKMGADVYWHDKGFMHQKVVLIDDEVATVGTANFDNRSFRLNFEITLLIADKLFANTVSTMLKHDLVVSRKVTLKEIEGKKFLFRFLVRAAELTAPIQ